MGVISVVMPAHDEAEFLEAAVREVTAGLRTSERDFEVIIVENGSADGTADVAAKLALELPEVRTVSIPLADYGAALRRGFLESTGELVANFDVDYFDLGFFEQAVARLAEDALVAIVVGSKRAPGAVDTRSWPRRTVTTTFALVLRFGFGLGVSDTHGMKVLRREPLRRVVANCRFGTDLFDTELVLRAERAGLRSVEIPVTVQERRPSRSSILSRIPRTLAGLARLRLTLWRERE